MINAILLTWTHHFYCVAIKTNHMSSCEKKFVSLNILKMKYILYLILYYYYKFIEYLILELIKFCQ